MSQQIHHEEIANTLLDNAYPTHSLVSSHDVLLGG